MGLKEILLRAQGVINNDIIAGSSFILGGLVDRGTTSYALTKHPLHFEEANKFAEKLINTFGTNPGLLAHQAITTVSAFLIAHALNKISGKVESKVKSGNLFLYTLGGGSVYASIHNLGELMQYYQFY